METPLSPERTTRELSATEIQIAIAEIADRLTRIAKAQSCDIDCDDENESAYESSNDHKLLRERFGIPDEVWIFRDEGKDLILELEYWKQFISSWVRGKLTDEDVVNMLLDADTVDEFDFGWVFMNRPGQYYTLKTGVFGHDNMVEFRRIGTRARTKSKKRFVSAIIRRFGPQLKTEDQT